MTVSRRVPPPLTKDVLQRLDGDIRHALGSIRTTSDSFVVNDTPWFGVAAKPVVMNQAEFISKRFQKVLHDERNWSVEQEIEGEKIDAYTLLASTGQTAVIARDRLSEVFSRLLTAQSSAEIDLAFAAVYQRAVKRAVFTFEGLPRGLDDLCKVRKIVNEPIRVGLEFETGNIASSSRALAKLDVLYRLGKIDVGVFVTCTDKRNAAARIWPSSNRNGSLEELDSHNYWKNIIVPLWVYGFQPDGFDRNAPYLRRDGSLYMPIDTGKTRRIAGKRYRVFRRFETDSVFLPLEPIE